MCACRCLCVWGVSHDFEVSSKRILHSLSGQHLSCFHAFCMHACVCVCVCACVFLTILRYQANESSFAPRTASQLLSGLQKCRCVYVCVCVCVCGCKWISHDFEVSIEPSLLHAVARVQPLTNTPCSCERIMRLRVGQHLSISGAHARNQRFGV